MFCFILWRFLGITIKDTNQKNLMRTVECGIERGSETAEMISI